MPCTTLSEPAESQALIAHTELLNSVISGDVTVLFPCRGHVTACGVVALIVTAPAVKKEILYKFCQSAPS